MNLRAAISVACVATFLHASAQHPVTLTIDTTVHVSPVSPMLYGLMTEEINHSYDGGLYAEMIANRNFEKTWEGFAHWNMSQEGSGRSKMEPASEGPSAALHTSMKLTVLSASAGNAAGFANDGWWGLAIRPATSYKGSFYAKPHGVGTARIRIISDDTGAVLASTTVPLRDDAWKQYSYTLTTPATIRPGQHNHLIVSFEQPGTVLFQLVSLFPPTFHDRMNGNRPDLMNLMAGMRPHFLRLPGGNYLEGDTIKERFNWKETIGPLVDRPTHRGPWSYQSTDGMGLLEMLEWCEDLRIDPVLAVYAGLSLRGEHVEGPALQPFIQDALDEIEYVTGDTSTHLGAMRARDGHPAPFVMHYIEIGNEDEYDKAKTYDQRFSQIASAIRDKYPQYKLIATTPTKLGNPDVLDDHYYNSPEEFFSMVHRYDKTDRNGPKIFIGEWATRIGVPTPNFAGALGDAAWMTAMERNSDVIIMASYAPLFTNVNPGGIEWGTDLIGYDALRAYGSPSYYAQALFSKHLGDYTVQTSADHEEGLLFWSATASTSQKMLFLKLVNASDKPQEINLSIAGAKRATAHVTTLHGATRYATNSIEHPTAISPVMTTLPIPAGTFKHTVSGNTIEVIDVPLL